MIRGITLIVLLGLALTLQAAPITYQGQLEDSDGPFDGSVAMRFLLFAAPAGGEAVAVHDAGSVGVIEGLFQVDLDYGDVFDGRPLWLEIEVAGSPLSQRQRVGASPQARFAQRDSSFCDAGGPLLGMRDDGKPLCGLTGVVDISSGGTVSCAVLDDGTAWCWGRGGRTLGSGRPIGDDAFGAVQVRIDNGGDDGGPLSNIVGIDVGPTVACAVDSSGQVWCWGQNNEGGVGNGSPSDVSRAVKVIRGSGALLDDARQVSAGSAHACAVDSANEVWCWGRNFNGQLGIGSTESQLRAQQVLGETDSRLTDIAEVNAGALNTCALSLDGRSWCWGDNSFGQLGTGEIGPQSNRPVRVRRNEQEDLTGVVSISANNRSTCVVVSDAGANQGYCWGDAEEGRLGNGATSGNFPFPQQVRVAAGQDDGGPLDQLTTAGSGDSVSVCAVRRDGSSWCWGRGFAGQLGDGNRTESSRAVQVHRDRLDRFGADGGPLTDVVRAKGGGQASCAVDRDRRAWCWGDNRSGYAGSERGRGLDTYGSPNIVGRAIPVLRLVADED